MESLPGLLAAQYRALSLPELVAVAAAALYLVLAIRQNIWCWFFAALSTALYVVLFVGAKLYMESLLNAFYFVMAAYGWYFWLNGGRTHAEPPVVRWSLAWHAAAIAGIAALSLASGFVLSHHTDAAWPYLDSLTTFSACWATFLVARKVFENWWYWLVIDTASIFIYWSRGLQLTSLLFVAYVIMIPFGLVAWTRDLRRQAAAAS